MTCKFGFNALNPLELRPYLILAVDLVVLPPPTRLSGNIDHLSCNLHLPQPEIDQKLVHHLLMSNTGVFTFSSQRLGTIT